MASSSGSTKVCFNSTCKEALEVPRQGWLRRTGDFADLCDRCASAFKDGKFCDTYHLHASGWRCCESCGKQIHCGCIVSFHMFVLLDAGGIECLNCAKTEFILTPNPTWPPPSRFLPGPAERIRDISTKNWRSIAGTGPVPWRQAPSLYNATKIQPEFHSRTPFEVELPSSIDRPLLIERLSSHSPCKNTTNEPSERLANESLRIGAPEMIGDRDTRLQHDGQHNSFGDISNQPFFYPNEHATPLSSFPPTFVAKDQKGEQENVSGIHAKRPCPPPLVGKQFANGNGIGPSHEAQAHSAKAQTRGRNQLLPRYWPRITDQELQQISEGSNAKITPLFEKVLSASDAGRIGRLVLPKKCAEAYLPPISQPEGYPLVVQDLTGKDWVLQFRYWPNNNSRMYVLEGVTPCIQSMQLQAGDTVTFSRLEPEGKLVMGFRKASLASPSDQSNEKMSARVLIHDDLSKSSLSRNPEIDKIPVNAKRKKGGKMGSNGKCLKLNNEEILQVNVTLEQLQDFLKPPTSNIPTIVLIEGIELENYQEAPIVGNPAIFLENHVGSVWSTEEEPTPSLTPENLEHTALMINHASCTKTMLENQEPLEPVEGLDTLSNLAALGGKASAATKHPRHKPDCTCIVCIQPPSGTKHKPTCTCSLCLAVKRCTQKDVETVGLNEPTTPPFKSKNIDLNIQPEREEESSFPVLDIRQQKLSL